MSIHIVMANRFRLDILLSIDIIRLDLSSPTPCSEERYGKEILKPHFAFMVGMGFCVSRLT